MADRIVVLRQGRIEQTGTPSELYERPVNRFVASFIGSPRMNFLSARIKALRPGAVEVAIAGHDGPPLVLPTVEGHPLNVGDAVEIGMRPEELRLGGGPVRLSMRVGFCEYIGGAVHLHALDHPAGRLVIRHAGGPMAVGEALEVGIEEARCHLFAADGARLSA